MSGSEGETVDFQRVKDAALAAKSAFPPSKQKVFSNYVEQLENDIKHGNHTTYQKIPDRIIMITSYVNSNQQNEDAKPFVDCLKKFSRCLKRGIDELDPLKYIKRAEDSTQIKVQRQSRPKSSKQRQSSGVSEITQALKETQRRLEKRYRSIQEKPIPSSFLKVTMTDIDLMENIETLAESFAEAAEKAAQRSGVSEITQALKVTQSRLKIRYRSIQGEPIPSGFLQDTRTVIDLLENIESLAESFAEAAEKAARKAETSVLKQKMNQHRKETDMKQLQDEVGSLRAEIQNPTSTMKWRKQPEGELALSIRAARKALSEEKQKKQKELTEIEQEINLLHAALENLQANTTQAKPPNGQLACRIRDAHRKILEEKSSNQKEKDAEDSVRQMAALGDKIQALWKTLPKEQQTAKEHSGLFQQLEDIDAALGSRDKQIKRDGDGGCVPGRRMSGKAGQNRKQSGY